MKDKSSYKTKHLFQINKSWFQSLWHLGSVTYTNRWFKLINVQWTKWTHANNCANVWILIKLTQSWLHWQTPIGLWNVYIYAYFHNNPRSDALYLWIRRYNDYLFCFDYFLLWFIRSFVWLFSLKHTWSRFVHYDMNFSFTFFHFSLAKENENRDLWFWVSQSPSSKIWILKLGLNVFESQNSLDSTRFFRLCSKYDWVVSSDFKWINIWLALFIHCREQFNPISTISSIFVHFGDGLVHSFHRCCFLLWNKLIFKLMKFIAVTIWNYGMWNWTDISNEIFSDVRT